MNIEPKKEEFRDVSHDVRAAQAILQYGVGAMVDFPEQTLMTAAPEYWGTANELHHIRDERLERQLGVDFFALPQKKGTPGEQGVAYVRFPRWYFCPKCRRFEPIEYWLQEYRRKRGSDVQKDPYMKKPICLGDKCRKGNRGIGLVPTRIVVACENGHIDDFPWVEWVHTLSHKEICSNPHLSFKTGVNSSAGLEGLTVSCETCHAKANLEHSFDKDGLKKIPKYHCHGNMPWRNEHEGCGCMPQAKQRGASVVYYPKIDSSLVIPPYSDRLRTNVLASEDYNGILYILRDIDENEPGKRDAMIASRFDTWVEKIASALHATRNAIEPILRALLSRTDSGTYLEESTEVYRQEEFNALNGLTPQHFTDGDFVREARDGREDGIPGVIQVALLHKIREVRTLVGFTRLEPASTGFLGVPTGNDEKERFQCVKKPGTRWYPGYEVRGEGIFIQFDNEMITNWLSKNDHACGQMSKLMRNASMNARMTEMKIDAKFIFLHTLSHLLIQRLSFECGYNSASLRERIYCDIDHPEFPMCGIFIYTACGDSEGTLGGLVRQGYSDRLRSIFIAALENACWCSNDPVCGESAGQGRNAMNLAACHACALLPETSCEEFNSLLDRTLLVGRILDRDAGFFSSWLNEYNMEEASDAI